MRKLAALLTLLLLARPAGAQTPAPQPLVQAENAFALSLYGALSQQPGNLFFSPYSVATALGMLYLGARGGTGAQIAQVLHLPPGWSRADYLKATPPPVDTSDDAFQLHAANALWGARGYSFNPAYISQIKASLGANLHPEDFSNPTAASQDINSWVSARTHGKIPDLLSPSDLSTTTRLVLTDAIYFNATWDQPFDPSNTSPQPFYPASGPPTAPLMMNITANFPLAQVQGAQILILPYSGGAAAMIIILPTPPNTLAALAATLTLPELNSWLSNTPSTLVQVTLPKFTSNSTFTLNHALHSLGMSNAFNPAMADFSGIARGGAHGLVLSSVIHQAYISVDESHTEAAAATDATMDMATAPAPLPSVPFTADHPFLYLIRSNITGAILFMGRMAAPSNP